MSKESQKPTTNASHTKPQPYERDPLTPERGQDACRCANVSLDSSNAKYVMAAKVNREPRESA